ncbi:MAG: J domain-containing protein [Nitrospirota bacterium]
MNDKDPKGYYHRLGVSPTASAAGIKVAFRQRAKEIHPDRNSSPHATREFQEINEAYNILNDPKARAQYDASGVETPQYEPRSTKEESPSEPIVCSSCGKVTAQPRYVIFYEVKSFIFVTTRNPIQGIYCHICAEKKALRSTIITWLLGWWGVPWGPIYSIHAIFNNLFGGTTPPHVNARLLAYQASVFAMHGKIELSRAIAVEALTFANKIKLGSEESDLATTIKKFLDSLDTGVSISRLKNVWSLFSRPFYVQSGIALIATISIWGLSVLETSDIASNQSFQERSISQASNISYVRPSIADNGSQWPLVSDYITGYPKRNMGGLSTVTIDNLRNDSDVFVKLFSLDSVPPVPVRVFFIRANEQFTVRDVKAGTYDVRYRDLDSGGLSKSESFELKEIEIPEGVRYSTITMTLYKITGGNMRTYGISESEFE